MSQRKKTKPKKFYSNGRIKRGPAPFAHLTRTRYRKALPELRRDFEDRCAYCMRHIGTKSEMQVDHFDPRRKDDKTQVYSNLFLSDAHCNGAKGDRWPSPEAEKKGMRFLNCCDEVDYGNTIFEDLNTHKLIGTTPAARYHIRIIDLNDPGLIEDRKRRYELMLKLAKAEMAGNLTPEAVAMAAEIRKNMANMIPAIPPPPGSWTVIT